MASWRVTSGWVQLFLQTNLRELSIMAQNRISCPNKVDRTKWTMWVQRWKWASTAELNVGWREAQAPRSGGGDVMDEVVLRSVGATFVGGGRQSKSMVCSLFTPLSPPRRFRKRRRMCAVDLRFLRAVRIWKTAAVCRQVWTWALAGSITRL